MIDFGVFAFSIFHIVDNFLGQRVRLVRRFVLGSKERLLIISAIFSFGVPFTAFTTISASFGDILAHFLSISLILDFAIP